MLSACTLGVATASSSAAAALLPELSRRLTVLSWGRNVEGQCGVEAELGVLVTRPTVLLDLVGAGDALQIAAGKTASGAVSEHGEALTWGDGRGGKLGHGNAESSWAPARVESLFGRCDVQSLSMGENHSLFLDTQGGVWACGENKEGQCGLGTPLEVIAQQHRKAFQDSFKSLRDAAALGNVQQSAERRDQRTRKYIQTLMQPQGGQQSFAGAAAGTHAQASTTRSWQHAAAGSMPQVTSTPDGARMSLAWGGFDPEQHLRSLLPGQQHTPTRIGRDAHPLMAWHYEAGSNGSGSGGSGGGSGASKGGPRMPTSPHASSILDQVGSGGGGGGGCGLQGEVVTGLAASRFFSAAVTASGDVWTFGACYNGALGSHSSWSTSAQKVSGPLAAALEANGGAVSVAAGGTFCLALTASGKVVVWGKLVGGEGHGASVLSLTSDGVSMTAGHRITAGVLPLSDITHIAAGNGHALLSDGERVWGIGRFMGKDGLEVGSAHMSQPAELMRLEGGDRVRQLACGAHSSGVVTEGGQLWMWGRLMERHHVDGLVRRYMSHSLESLPEDLDLSWPGFGADKPSLVRGLSDVRSLALGGWHALVATA